MKIRICFTLIIVILFLAACGSRSSQENNVYGYEQDYNDSAYEHLEEESLPSYSDGGAVAVAETSPEPTPEVRAPLTREGLLYDFDYMMQLMEDSFPYFGVAYRRLGVDIRALADKTRAIIENYPYSMQELADSIGIAIEDMPELDEQVFWAILSHEFFDKFRGLAHADVLALPTFSSLRHSFAGASSPFNREAFRNPVTIRFYEEQDEFIATIFDSEDWDMLYFILRRPPPGTIQSDDMIQEEPTPNLVMEIIEDGKIAYMSFASFMYPSFPLYWRPLTEFYREIYSYEHLIIDIRNNSGGSIDFWRMLIMYPLWADRDYMPNMLLYAFYVDSELGQLLGDAHHEAESDWFASRFVPENDYMLTIDEIVAASHLPYINEDDLRHLAYGNRFNTSIANIEGRHFQGVHMTPMSHYPFHGQIWLLTCSYNASSTALFSRHAKYMGFATLVGEQVSGAYTAHFRTFFSLPNTGIMVTWDIDYLVDQYGRSLEEFPTIPHYFNREGMDALETVLSMISEGTY